MKRVLGILVGASLVLSIGCAQPYDLRLDGTLKNMTAKKFEKVEVDLNLTDHLGSQIGAIGATVSNLEPQGSANFRVSIHPQNAYNALVREIHGR